jgi:putative hydrolase of the HAD superfamily
MTPQFIYFDLGNVILNFSRSRQYRQMGDILGVSPEKISQFVEQDNLERQSETGQITPEEAHRLLCCAAESDCDFSALALADSDIFELNTSIEPLIVELARCGCRMGLLSNTSKNHWEFCHSRFALLRDCFEHYVLSYEVGIMKPETDIYRVAIQKTGLPAGEIFYTDDLEPNVLAAKECGMDAVLFTDTAQLTRELSLRGLQLTF